MSIYDAAMKYQQEQVPLVVFAGTEYGNGSSRDWAAKGTSLLGVRAVICQSFERIHRSNLVGMGVLPLTFEEGTSWQSLGLKGDEQVTIRGLQGDLKPRQTLIGRDRVQRRRARSSVPLLCRIDTLDELEYFRNGGILHYVLRQLAASARAVSIEFWQNLQHLMQELQVDAPTEHLQCGCSPRCEMPVIERRPKSRPPFI